MDATAPTTPQRRRSVIEPLSPGESWERLRTASIARVAHLTDGRPHVSIVNITVEGEDILVRSMSGSRLAAALARPGTDVAVEVDDVDSASRGGWSVIVHGTMEPVLDQVEAARLDRVNPPSWLLGDHAGTWLRLHATALSGRQVRAPDQA